VIEGFFVLTMKLFSILISHIDSPINSMCRSPLQVDKFSVSTSYQ
jgi:hypothetical protein